MSEKAKEPVIRFKGFTEEWEEKKMGEDLVSIHTGTNLLGSTENAGMPLLKMGNIQRGYFDTSKVEYLAENEHPEEEDIANYGDFFFNTRNTLELVGKGATWMENSGKYAFNSNIARFELKDIDTVFFNYLYNTEDMTRQIHARAMGTTSVAAIYPRTLNSVEYFVPNKEEQQKIGSYFRQLDHLITLYQRKYNKLTSVKKSMLQKMFPASSQTVPVLRFAGFTDKWQVRKLGEVGKTFTGLSGKTAVDFGHGEAKFLPYLNIFNNPIADTSFLESIEIDNSQNQIQYGDVFFTTSSETPEEVGMSSVWLGKSANIYLNSFCFGFRPTIEFNPYYLGYLLRSDTFRKPITILAQGISRFNISKTKVMEIEIPLPSLSEQQKIGSYFRQLDHLIALHQQELQKLQNLKKACLKKMFV